MLPHHPAIALAEQRQTDLRHDAEQARLARSYRLARPDPSTARRPPLVAAGAACS